MRRTRSTTVTISQRRQAVREQHHSTGDEARRGLTMGVAWQVSTEAAEDQGEAASPRSSEGMHDVAGERI